MCRLDAAYLTHSTCPTKPPSNKWSQLIHQPKCPAFYFTRPPLLSRPTNALGNPSIHHKSLFSLSPTSAQSALSLRFFAHHFSICRSFSVESYTRVSHLQPENASETLPRGFKQPIWASTGYITPVYVGEYEDQECMPMAVSNQNMTQTGQA